MLTSYSYVNFTQFKNVVWLSDLRTGNQVVEIRHELPCCRHHKNMASATSCMWGLDESRRITCHADQLSQRMITFDLEMPRVAWRHHKTPISSLIVLLLFDRWLSNCARNRNRDHPGSGLSHLRTPPPAAVSEASWKRNETERRLKSAGYWNFSSTVLPSTSADMGARRLKKHTLDQKSSWRCASCDHSTVPAQNLLRIIRSDRLVARSDCLMPIVSRDVTADTNWLIDTLKTGSY